MRAWVAWGLIGEAGAGVYRWASDSVQGNPASCVGVAEELQHHSNYIMECDGSDKHGITTPAMVTIVCY